MLPVYGHDRWCDTGRTSDRYGEPRHRLERRYRWEGRSHRLSGSGNDKNTEVTERRVLDSITQPNEHTFN